MKNASKNTVVYYSVLCQCIIVFYSYSVHIANIRFFFEIMAVLDYFSV